MRALTTTAAQRLSPQTLSNVFETLATRFKRDFFTSQAQREQHTHTTTWIAPQLPDAVVLARSIADIQDVVRICARYHLPIIPFGAGTSLEGQVTAPSGGICLDLREMNRVLAVHAEALDCVIAPGIPRKTLNEHLRG